MNKYEILIGEYSSAGPFDVRVVTTGYQQRVVEHLRRIRNLHEARQIAQEKSRQYDNAPVYG